MLCQPTDAGRQPSRRQRRGLPQGQVRCNLWWAAAAAGRSGAEWSHLLPRHGPRCRPAAPCASPHACVAWPQHCCGCSSGALPGGAGHRPARGGGSSGCGCCCRPQGRRLRAGSPAVGPGGTAHQWQRRHAVAVPHGDTGGACRAPGRQRRRPVLGLALAGALRRGCAGDGGRPRRGARPGGDAAVGRRAAARGAEPVPAAAGGHSRWGATP